VGYALYVHAASMTAVVRALPLFGNCMPVRALAPPNGPFRGALRVEFCRRPPTASWTEADDLKVDDGSKADIDSTPGSGRSRRTPESVAGKVRDGWKPA